MSLSRLFRILHQWLRAVSRKDRMDAELERELAFHFEQLVREYADEGMTREDARRAARRALGNVPLLAEQCQDHRRVTWLHDLRRDVTHGLRMLARNPGFTCVAVASLGLGIGANTAILGVMDAVLRESLHIPNDGRLVVARTFPQENPRQETHASIAEFMLRSSGEPMSLLPAARRIVAEIDRDRPLANILTMEQQLGAAVPQRRDYILVLGAFALTATLLAAIGIYGVMAYSVAQRTREIGIRMALGAGARDVVVLVGRSALFVVSSGLALGLAGSVALTQLLVSQLWGVKPTDPATFAGVLLLLLSVSVLACSLPTRRATGVSPTVALRGE